MQRIHQGAAVFFIAFSAFVVWEAWNLEYYTPMGPGAGFFPLWLGVVLGGLSLVLLIQVSGKKGKPKESDFLPDREGLVRLLSIIGSIVLATLVMDILGFQLSMFLLLVFLLLIPGRQRLLLSLIFAIMGSVGIYHLFGRYLDVQLPRTSIEILSRLGL